MRTVKRWVAAALGILWLLPSLAICCLGFHLALAHHPHAHGEHAHAEHASAAVVAEIVFHGHHHAHADTADHSHPTIHTLSRLPERPSIAQAPVDRPFAHANTASRAIDRIDAPPRAVPALFHTHCALLI
ncbi:MAG: hypothetical protein AAF772_13820 [Acidobacteriota bacterium]